MGFFFNSKQLQVFPILANFYFSSFIFFTDLFFFAYGGWTLFYSDSHTRAAELLFLKVLINVAHAGRGCRAPSLGLCLPLAVLLVAVRGGLQPRSCGK